ncbi:MAG: 1-phosphofructokinase [Erysipelotrichaceae bacterium]|nr:1-phosphofructokinase [Erysipelotrichaceae bacterium]
MIYTITFNPSLDYIASCENFRLGETNRASKEIIFPGGKGINVSIVLSNFGMDTTALGFLAGFTGEEIRRLIVEKGIRNEMIPLANGFSRINVKLKSKVESELNGMGPRIDEEAIGKLYEKLDELTDEDTLCLAGSIPSSMPATMYSDIMKHLQGRGIRIVVDATRDLLMNVLEYKPFLIKPNIDEIAELFNVELNSGDEVVPYAKKLQEKGAVNVLVSMGGDGAVLIDEFGNVHQSQAPKGQLVNSVGAGDSMVAGFLYGYLVYHDYRQAFRYGLATGSASAFKEELATLEDVEKLYSKTWGEKE